MAEIHATIPFCFLFRRKVRGGAWMLDQQTSFDAERLVFVDDAGTSTKKPHCSEHSELRMELVKCPQAVPCNRLHFAIRI